MKMREPFTHHQDSTSPGDSQPGLISVLEFGVEGATPIW
jgi:hypothetical protein